MTTARDNHGEQAGARNRKTPVTDNQTVLVGSSADGRATNETVRIVQELEQSVKQSTADLEVSEARFRTLVEQIPAVIYTAALDAARTTIYVSPQVETMLGFTPAEYQDSPHIWRQQLHPDDRERALALVHQSHTQHHPFSAEYRMLTHTGETIWINDHATVVTDGNGKPWALQGVMFDITERKRAETYREMSRDILQALNLSNNLQTSIQYVLTLLQNRTGFDAVGLRLQNGEDFPYFTQKGFSKDFLRTENTLLGRGKDGRLCRDKNGNLLLECTCGLVISGKTDPSGPLFTPGGSYWTNDAFALLDLPPGQDPRLHPRNNCIYQGYASVALIPVRTKERIVGLIQLNDKRKSCFSRESIAVLEDIAAHIGSALMRKQAEAELMQSREVLRALLGRLEQTREEERTRLSRDMHDDLGQNLTAIKMDLRWIERKTECTDESKDLLAMRTRAKEATVVVDAITRTVQELAASLRPGVLDKLGVGSAIQFESRRFEARTGIVCRVSLSDTLPDIPAATATTVFRIFQECLTNIARHSGATQTSVLLRMQDGYVVLRVHDNGKGIAPEAFDRPESLGLLGMQERAAESGGEVLFCHGKNRGTHVTIQIPLSGASAE